MENDHNTAAERRARWDLETEALDEELRFRRLQRRTEIIKIVLATLAVIAALSQAATTVVGLWSTDDTGRATHAE